jgi:hypothetical protein
MGTFRIISMVIRAMVWNNRNQVLLVAIAFPIILTTLQAATHLQIPEEILPLEVLTQPKMYKIILNWGIKTSKILINWGIKKSKIPIIPQPTISALTNGITPVPLRPAMSLKLTTTVTLNHCLIHTILHKKYLHTVLTLNKILPPSLQLDTPVLATLTL